MTKLWITTNGRASESATALAACPGFKRSIKGGLVKPGDVVINWGSSTGLGFEPKPGVTVINKPSAVLLASNKLKAFSKFDDYAIDTPQWTTDKQEAIDWKAKVVFARTKLTGHSGEGIIIVNEDDEMPDAPLYTRYIFKEREYRVHVVGNKVIDTQRKIRDPSKDVVSWKVRSHDNGFIFARAGINQSDVRDSLAIKAVNALDLDFGAVDLIVDKNGIYYVLEVNTAPGLEGQTLTNYSECFRDKYGA